MGEPSGFTRMRGRGESTTTAELLERLGRAAKAPLQQLSKMRFPFKAPSLIDRSAPYFSGIKRFGLPKLIAYYKDPFHTLLNLPWGHFIAVFFATYMTEQEALSSPSNPKQGGSSVTLPSQAAWKPPAPNSVNIVSPMSWP
ncbi:ATP-sensitive inward rectifier potassium channel 11 [Haematococcus lacustris]|uniref:ATP-sensitive inward rectifier potassium channel 11 n=1 Tax=Haematococcus lacustris TaxID=44745 RepID=A0A6A0AAW2_HAELA|nr:ATP-sensitive inward rectifier potassium channel 11 [Haematococcus lacustris]